MQKIDIAEKYRPVYEEQAKDKNGGFKGNQYTSGSVPKLAPDQKSKTRDVLANLAGVSHDTYSKGKKILDYERNLGQIYHLDPVRHGRFTTVSIVGLQRPTYKKYQTLALSYSISLSYAFYANSIHDK